MGQSASTNFLAWYDEDDTSYKGFYFFYKKEIGIF